MGHAGTAISFNPSYYKWIILTIGRAVQDNGELEITRTCTSI